MPLTVAYLAGTLITRYGAGLTYVGIAPGTASSPCAAILDAVGQASMFLGVTPADPANPVTSDLSTVPPRRYPQLAELAEIRLVETMIGNRGLGGENAVDETTGTDSMKFDQFYSGLEKTLARKEATYVARYGPLRPTRAPYMAPILACPPCPGTVVSAHPGFSGPPFGYGPTGSC